MIISYEIVRTILFFISIFVIATYFIAPPRYALRIATVYLLLLIATIALITCFS